MESATEKPRSAEIFSNRFLPTFHRRTSPTLRLSLLSLLLTPNQRTMSMCGSSEDTSTRACNLSWLIIFVSWLLVTPATIYWFRDFHKHRHHLMIKKRNPSLSIWTVFLTLLFTSLVIPLQFMSTSIAIIPDNSFVWALFTITIVGELRVCVFESFQTPPVHLGGRWGLENVQNTRL